MLEVYFLIVGVSVDGQSNHFSSVSDNNPIHASMPYYGVIEDIGCLITVNLEFLCSIVVGLMQILGYAKTKWALH